MGLAKPQFPANVWNGLSANTARTSRLDSPEDDTRDWDQIVSEMIAIQEYTLNLSFLSNLSLIELGSDNPADLRDIGFFGPYVSSGTKYAGMFRDASDGKFHLFTGLTVAPTDTVNIGGSGYTPANFVIGEIESRRITVDTFDANDEGLRINGVTNQLASLVHLVQGNTPDFLSNYISCSAFGGAEGEVFKVTREGDIVSRHNQTFFGSNDVNSSQFLFRKARGPLSAPLAVNFGDRLGTIDFSGWGGVSGFINTAQIRALVAGTVADTRVASMLVFATGTDAVPTVLTDRAAIDEFGRFGINVISPIEATLHVVQLTTTTVGQFIQGISNQTEPLLRLKLGSSPAGNILEMDTISGSGGNLFRFTTGGVFHTNSVQPASGSDLFLGASSPVWINSSTGFLYLDNSRNLVITNGAITTGVGGLGAGNGLHIIPADSVGTGGGPYDGGSVYLLGGAQAGGSDGNIFIAINSGGTSRGNLGFGQLTFGTNAVRVLGVGNGTAPTTSPANCFQMWSADIAGGDACPHFRTEDDKVLRLGAVSLLADVHPITNDTYYLGKNDDDSPLAWKGVILRDQTTGTYYRLQIDSGAVSIIDLTD